MQYIKSKDICTVLSIIWSITEDYAFVSLSSIFTSSGDRLTISADKLKIEKNTTDSNINSVQQTLSVILQVTVS